MTNMALINQVVKEVVYLYEAEHITENSDSIKRRTLNWYNHTDIADFETLVAAVWLGDYNKSVDYDVIIATRDMLFPQIPVEYTNFHIHEIEEALDDELYW